MKRLCLFLTLLCFAVFACPLALPQATESPCFSQTRPSGFIYTGSACASTNPFGSAVPEPLVDGNPNLTDHYGNTGLIISLYGPYGVLDERQTNSTAGNAHYQQGKDLAAKIMPRCLDGSLPGAGHCSAQDARIVFLFLGFSNCDVEICGGHVDAWDVKRRHPGPTLPPLPQLAGQPCATKCPNLTFNYSQQQGFAYNIAQRDGISDGYDQMSLLRRVYPDNNPSNWLVGSKVAVFNGAFGGQTLDKWDPTDQGFYWLENCDYDSFTSTNPECNYFRVKTDLQSNGFSEQQVQAIFIKAGEAFPTCDLQHNFCVTTETPDANVAAMHYGNILRYLKCCKLDDQHHSTGNPRYPNLRQVFITSRTYGGYANGDPTHGAGDTCLNPEPFAFELGLAVQNVVVSQISADPGPYVGAVDYLPDANGNNLGHAPWVDWGPYLWANGEQARNFDQLRWCNGQIDQACQQEHDVLYGDVNDPVNYWGDYTHPAGDGVSQVGRMIADFINKNTGHEWIKNWIWQ